MAKIKLHKPEAENLCINGSMDFAQRGSSFVGPVSGTYTLDRFQYFKVGTMVNDVNQVANVPSSEKELTNCLEISTTTTDVTLGAGDFLNLTTKIEGFDYTKLIGKYLNISFWVRATKTGISCVGIRNSAVNRSYISEYTINSSLTWERKTIKIKADTGGTWLTDNQIGAIILGHSEMVQLTRLLLMLGKQEIFMQHQIK